jgi:hypothetical protein
MEEAKGVVPTETAVVQLSSGPTRPTQILLYVDGQSPAYQKDAYRQITHAQPQLP